VSGDAIFLANGRAQMFGRKAVAEITGAPINAGIYSTSTGEFVVYGSNELAAEWERLRNLPPENFTWRNRAWLKESL